METKPQTNPIEVTLVDGRKALVRRPKARDLVRADDAVGGSKNTNKFKFLCALIAQVTLIDGKPIVYEDALELDGVDLDTLATAAGSDFLASTGESSQDSSNGASHSPS